MTRTLEERTLAATSHAEALQKKLRARKMREQDGYMKALHRAHSGLKSLEKLGWSLHLLSGRAELDSAARILQVEMERLVAQPAHG